MVGERDVLFAGEPKLGEVRNEVSAMVVAMCPVTAARLSTV
jgi:hypothetical protein